ncbi:MBD3 [Cervus elaphus hippelaphus]|uniref:MBD3 n=1 Tax=Cervus elaphus hippelaphus TaxID=46360 RepID=A0A212D0H6_CEREH|nr:MBD3 [Cervus elaphus hippelaphus]
MPLGGGGGGWAVPLVRVGLSRAGRSLGGDTGLQTACLLRSALLSLGTVGSGPCGRQTGNAAFVNPPYPNWRETCPWPGQTASIFKQPVTKITNHPSNKVKSDPQKAVEQPRQLFWEKKLSGLNAFDIAEELVKTMDLPKGLQGVGPGCTDETLLSAIASALHTSTTPITGQLSAAVEKNPGVWLNTAQPLCKAFMVTDEDIRKQEELVQQVRKRLEEALMADMLAHVEELARDGEAPLDRAGADEEDDEEEEEEEPDQDPEMEHV